jgi:hypothetical protein
MRDREPECVDNIKMPPRDEDSIVRHGGNGRPLIRDVAPDGTVLETSTYYSRCTTFIKCIDRNEALERWQQARAMEGFSARPDEFQARVVEAAGDRAKLSGVWLDALRAGGAETAAHMGTAMHRVAEWHDLGVQQPNLPERYARGLEAWIHITKYFAFREVEKFMVHDELQVAGTPDRVARYLPCDNCGRTFYILDLKNGRVDEYTELQIAMQFGMYANSAYYDVHTGERRYQDDICRCKGITVKLFLDTGEATTFWTDIWTGYKIAQELAPQVHTARKEHALLVPFEPVPVLDVFIEQAGSKADLRGLYHTYRTFWTAEHTRKAEMRIRQIEGE